MERKKLSNGKDLVIFTNEDLKKDVIDERYSFKDNLKAPKGEWMTDIFNKAFMILFIANGKTTILKDKTIKLI
jgi:hypothetical protein